ncbi:MAG: phosphatase PAP2 family protein [Bacteroidales bacterium]
MKRFIANAISIVFHPLLMPTYGVGLFYLYTYLYIFMPLWKGYLLGLVFLLTGLVPALSVIALHKLKIVSNYEITNKNERLLPYLFTLSSYSMCIFLLWKLNVPIWVVLFLLGGEISLIVNLFINNWWKISAHMTGIGGVVGSVFALCYLQNITPLWMFFVLLLCAGLLGSSRIYLKQHTLGQVIAGFFCGFLSIFFTVYLFT